MDSLQPYARMHMHACSLDIQLLLTHMMHTNTFTERCIGHRQAGTLNVVIIAAMVCRQLIFLIITVNGHGPMLISCQGE